MIFKISLFDSKTDATPKPAQRTWAELLDWFANPAIRAEKDGSLFSPAIFDPPRRAKENAKELSLLVLDYDSGLKIEEGLRPWCELGLRSTYHTTHSHQRTTTDHPVARSRYRVVLPLAEPIPANLFPALWRWAAERSGGAFDPVCKDPSRIFYAPAKADEDAPYEWGDFEGEPLDWRALDLREADEPAARIPPSQTGRRPDAYAQAALANEVSRVRGAANGSRNATLNKAAFALGQLVGAGVLSAGEVEFSLLGAAVGAGLPEGEARLTIQSGLRAGEKEPRVLPATPGPSRANGPQQNQSVRSVQSVRDSAQPEPWDLPVPFREFDLPAFPLEALSSWQRSFVEQLAEATQTPADLAAVLSLSAVAAAVARNVEIEARSGWREPLAIYALTVAESANRKSAVVSEITRPLERFESELVRDAQPLIDAAQNEYKIAAARLEKAQKDCAKLSGDALANRKAEAKALAIELGALAIPAVPRLLVDDCTPETLASRLAEQGGRIALFSAEGGIFETIAGRYSNGVPNLDVFLKGHAGDSLRVDRRDRSERIERPALTIGLAVQPDVIRGLAQKPGFRGRGLLGRFLYSLPQSRLGARKSRVAPVTDEAARTWERYLIRLAAIKPAEVEDGESEPITLRLSSEADDYLAQFQDEIEPQLAEGGEYPTISEWAGKLCGAAVRLAGILHCADHAINAPRIPGEVPATTFKRAVQIANYLIPHSLAAHAEMGADPLIEDARYVLRWLVRERLDDASKRDIHRGCRRFKKITELDPVLALLEEHNYLRPLLPPGDSGSRPGRKVSQIYTVNPALYLSGQKGQKGQNPVQNAGAATGGNSSHMTGQKGQKGQNTPDLIGNRDSVLSVLSVPNLEDWNSEPEPGEEDGNSVLCVLSVPQGEGPDFGPGTGEELAETEPVPPPPAPKPARRRVSL